MTISDLIAGCGLFICAQAGGRWLYSMVHGRRQPSWSPPLPQVTLRLADSHPYRALNEAAGPDAAQLALNVSDEAVRRERERIVAIARAVKVSAPGYAAESIQAIIDAVNGGA